MALHPAERVESAWGKAARNVASGIGLGIAVITASLAPAGAQSLRQQAQTLITPRLAVPPDAQAVKPILEVHCRYLFDRADEKIQKEGLNFISPTTRKALIAFWAFGPDERPHCNGPASTRVIPWETDTDFAFVMALGDLGSIAYKPVDFRIDYGFKPAARPTVPGTPMGQRKDGAKAPALAAK